MEMIPNATESEIEDLSFCYNNSSTIDPVYEKIVYWLEGVVLTSVACPGIMGNIMTIAVLVKLGKLHINVFNQVI
jgi:hypothetical protein